MRHEILKEDQLDEPGNRPFKVSLPGFIVDEPVGLGEAIKRVTGSFGIKPCGGCEARATALNSWMVFSRKK